MEPVDPRMATCFTVVILPIHRDIHTVFFDFEFSAKPSFCHQQSGDGLGLWA